jgi:hypothetical protein
MRQELRWIRILGVLSVFPSLYFWAAMATYQLWTISLPGNPGFIVTCVLLSALASVVAAVQWTRWDVYGDGDGSFNVPIRRAQDALKFRIKYGGRKSSAFSVEGLTTRRTG